MSYQESESTSSGSVPVVRPPDLAGLAEELVSSATDRGIALTGQGGLLTALTRQVLQSALEAEMAHHLGYDKHAVEGRGSGNCRVDRSGLPRRRHAWLACVTGGSEPVRHRPGVAARDPARPRAVH